MEEDKIIFEPDACTSTQGELAQESFILMPTSQLLPAVVCGSDFDEDGGDGFVAMTTDGAPTVSEKVECLAEVDTPEAITCSRHRSNVVHSEFQTIRQNRWLTKLYIIHLTFIVAFYILTYHCI